MPISQLLLRALVPIAAIAALACAPDAPLAPVVAPIGAATADIAEDCGPGHYVIFNVGCFPCPAGQYQPGPAQAVCRSCPLGTTSNIGAAACTPAPAGYYTPSQFPNSIVRCEPGTYQFQTGRWWCDDAPPGTFVPYSGATAYTLCPAGTFTDSAGNTSCTSAPAGNYIPTAGYNRFFPCEIGTYQPLAGKSSCLPAPIGSYVSVQEAASATPCPAGTTTTAVGATSSAQCVTRPLTLGNANLWIGLKNSDDVGLRLDVRAEVLLNGLVVGSGELQDVPGGSSGFNNAVLRTIGLAMNGAVSVPSGALLTFRPSVRRTCFGSGHTSGTVRFWYDGPAIDQGTTRNAGSRFAATVGTESSDFFMHAPATLSVTAGTARQFVDVAVNSSAACPARPFSSLGEWSITQ